MTGVTREVCGIALAVLVATGTAYAQPLTPVEVEPCEPSETTQCPAPDEPRAVEATPPPVMEPREPRRHVVTTSYAEPRRSWFERVGFAMTIGGGVDDFASEGLRDTTTTGGAWNVRAIFGTHTHLGLEASYLGSAQSIDALGLGDDALLIGNGIQGALRLNATTNATVQPFLFVGGAWRHYTLSNEDFNTSDISDSDDVFEIPFGFGVGGYFGGVLVDLRGEYRVAMKEDMVPRAIGGDSSSMDRWGVTGSVGYSF